MKQFCGKPTTGPLFFFAWNAGWDQPDRVWAAIIPPQPQSGLRVILHQLVCYLWELKWVCLNTVPQRFLVPIRAYVVRYKSDQKSGHIYNAYLCLWAQGFLSFIYTVLCFRSPWRCRFVPLSCLTPSHPVYTHGMTYNVSLMKKKKTFYCQLLFYTYSK